MDISPIFNIDNITKYFESNNELIDNLHYPKKKTCIIERILNRRIRKSTRGKIYMEYLVQWIDKPIEDNSWITQAKLDLYDLG